ncbi:hypothetical protein [Novosphingobium taihuense]|uniref:Benzoyl-CoA reductase/2-hydroxyglutaryl-CoA dehydratase subunit BcrC/BadD/HgdB n=1 Tax=Novosphingobium taihuense TaxID=260085 RepID=A0A7W7AEP4_9SPHN|nr:hypothetical protein [Novosphingobium taihuense]MBB4614954.1 hypothetical protein [Novosphingobium taihuense]TWH84605.1 hypothetical protein IQ25_02360 [Novosphingobium taihuense]
MFAYAGPNLPHDLFEATGRNAGPLTWNIDRAMPAADRWLESKFAPWTRSTLQDWADGALDHLEAVVFSRADDSAQRLYYYLCELRRAGSIRGPEPLVLDIAKSPRESSIARDEVALRKLAERFGVDEAALSVAILAGNEKRAASTIEPLGEKVCLIAGSPLPDARMHRMVARSGWSAVGRTLADEWQDAGNLVDEDGDSFAALARQLHARRLDTRGFFDRSGALTDVARNSGANAAILWLIEEDDTTVWHLPAMRTALEAQGLPVMVATRRDWSCADGIDTEIAAFLAGVAS